MIFGGSERRALPKEDMATHSELCLTFLYSPQLYSGDSPGVCVITLPPLCGVGADEEDELVAGG